jgi:hypothetical protein
MKQYINLYISEILCTIFMVLDQNTHCFTSGSQTVFICSQLIIPTVTITVAFTFTTNDWIHIFVPKCLV